MMIKERLNNMWFIKVAKKVLHPVKNFLKNTHIRKESFRARKHYDDVISSFRESGRKKINFAAYVVFDSTYGMDGVVRLMINNRDHWNPKIVIIPDIIRGDEHAKNTYMKTRDFFIKYYGEEYVMDGWDIEKDVYYDYTDCFDIIYYANPYDVMVNEYHSITYASKRNVLPIYVSYGYDVGKYTTKSRLKGLEINLVWKCFVDTVYTYNDYKKIQILKGKNVAMVGYSKMDALFKQKRSLKNKKKILISPHHTVTMKELPLSNFLKYSDLIVELPDRFPDVDFVFRPHPLLFTTLVNQGIWTNDKINEYIETLQNKGVEYSVGGDYFDLFSECDAIVNDCGSFTIEWLFTGKPGCFVYNENLKDKYLTTLMNKAINQYTIAQSREDILNFIESVFKTENKMEYKMEEWVRTNVAINYPHVSECILKELSKEFF